MTKFEIAKLIGEAKRQWAELRLMRQYGKADALKHKIQLLKAKLKEGL